MKTFLSMSLLVMLFISCNKEESLAPSVQLEEEELDATKYYPLAIGNYWVYQRFAIDAEGNATPQNQMDSIRVIADSLIDGKRYFVAVGSKSPFVRNSVVFLYRNDQGKLVDHNGEVIITPFSFSKPFHQGTIPFHSNTIYSETIMQEGGTQFTPIGTFNSLIRRTYHNLDSKIIIHNDEHYVEGIGLISWQVKYMTPMLTKGIYDEYRLIDYQLN